MRIENRSRPIGSALLIILILTGLMGIGLASYMILVRYQNLSVARSQSWNSCIPIIEAGVEEAMTHINRSGITNLLSAGWALEGGVYTKARALGDSYYAVAISQADPPVIVSEGHVPVPLNPTAPVAFVAVTGLDLPADAQYTTRKVRVTTRKDGMWTLAMVAKGAIDLMGNNIETDSFDSGNAAFSTSGQYDHAKRRDKGDVATNSKIVNSLSVGNANINGNASTGPGGSIDIGPGGAVGDLTWNLTHTGIQFGHTNNDMNVYFRDINLPYSAGSGFTAKSGSLGGTNYQYYLDGGDFSMTDLKLSGSKVMLITNHVHLLVTGTIDITGNSYIEIAKNSSLELYMDGPSASIGGNAVVNRSGFASNFLYFGTTNNTSLAFSGNGTFIGAIYAPEADFTLGGGGSGIQDFIGSSVSNTVKMNGHFKFHYDEALGRSDWARGYVVNSWNEI